MEYHVLLDLATELGYRLAMCGAETYRVEESINRVLASYGISSEVFAIPNCLTVSIETEDNQSLTRMRRIGYHGNDLDAVERYSAISRLICTTTPDPAVAAKWLKEADEGRRYFSTPIFLLGNWLGSFGFALFFGGTLADSLCAGFCGLIVGLVSKLMDHLKVNQFFSILSSAFLMAVPAYALCRFGVIDNADTTIIGTLMLLVPGLLFTNAMRDIIFGDTNSGTNRIVQVLLIAAAIALGTATALNLATEIWGAPVSTPAVSYSMAAQLVFCFISCVGFAILFNIHGFGIVLTSLGGCIAWAIYLLALRGGVSDTMSYFYATIGAAAYSEIMARIRKCPAISYLVVSVFPLLPGAGVYYTMNHAVQGDMAAFSQTGTHTIAIAGAMAVGILMISTAFRIWAMQKAKLRHH